MAKEVMTRRSTRLSALGFGLLASVLALGACGSLVDSGDSALRNEVQKYLDQYSTRFQRLQYEANEAEWESVTRIVEGDIKASERVDAAKAELASFTGSVINIELSRAYLKRRRELPPLQVEQLEAILFAAGGNPQIVKELVETRIAAETAQSHALNSFKFQLDGEPTTPNAIDEILRKETNLDRRRRAWEASKEIGPTLRGGLVQLRSLRNDTVRALGYSDFFAYKASQYGMSTTQLAAKLDELQRELRPLFTELHTWMRYELAGRYGERVPDLIPAHWLPDRWGQDWSAMLDVPGYDLDGVLREKTPQWIVEQGERFYVSLGFEKLPQTFWERSSLYPVAPDAGYTKNTHASAWHMDLDHDVRVLMSVEPNSWWYETAHHELGHIYYYLSYSNGDVPPLLRDGASRAFHEAVGSLMGLAAMQPRFLSAVGLTPSGGDVDPMQLMLKEALNYVAFIPWSAGIMFQFEKELYADELPQDRWNQRWWELVARYQGIAPPSARGETYCDAATKTHINDDAAEYYDYALSYVILFQLHDHIARQILLEDAHDTNYYGRKNVGSFLRSILKPGASVSWRTLLRDKTGSDLSARPMVDYFEPLRQWLMVKNEGRTVTLQSLDEPKVERTKR